MIFFEKIIKKYLEIQINTFIFAADYRIGNYN